jgi:hypothetical protein
MASAIVLVNAAEPVAVVNAILSRGPMADAVKEDTTVAV